MTDRPEPTQLEPVGPRAVDLWDRMEPTSVINKVEPHVAGALLSVSQEKPELFGMGEQELYKYLSGEQARPSATENRLRLQFWLEYDRAQTDGNNMRTSAIHAGVCSKQYFHAVILKKAEKVAWMMTPPVHYTVKIEEGLDFGIDRMRDILELDPKGFSLKPGEQLKLMELQAKITWMLEQRVKGAVAQRIEQRNMNLNVNTTDKQVAAAMAGASMDELSKRIKDLEARERRALNLPEPKAVESTVVDIE
jgi:hypothetical protein